MLLVVACLSVTVLAGRQARAQEPPPQELMALEQELDEALGSLTTDNCVTACRALESMIRAADKICLLAPGERCEAAQKKVAAARERVRQACPDCESAALSRQPEEPTARPKFEKSPPASKGAPDEAYGPPEAADSGGGACAACAIGRRPADHHGALLFFLALVLAATRRRRREVR